MKKTQNLRSILVVLVVLVVILGIIAAYAGLTLPTPWNSPASPTSTGSPTMNNDKFPGTEEFGLTKRQLVEKIEAVEALLAKCMSANGFEYIAVDYKTVRRGMKADKSLPGLSEKEYIAKHGFGISTMFTGKPPQLADATTPAKIGLGEQNVRIFNSLSPADQAAYTRTLLGENPDATFAVGIEIENFSWTGGCTREAIEQMFTPEELQFTYTNPLDAYIGNDPRMLTAYEKFADCMRKAGFNYKHPDEVELDLRERLFSITAGQPIEKLSPESLAALKALQAEERLVSVVAFDCEEDIVDPVEARIERELYGRPPK